MINLITGLPLTLPLIGPSKMWPRMIGIAVTLSPSFLLLSLSYEVIFYVFLITTAAVWVNLESSISRPSPWQQMRRSYFFVCDVS
jgi:Phosphatidylinositolglycan class N (PIG-N)